MCMCVVRSVGSLDGCGLLWFHVVHLPRSIDSSSSPGPSLRVSTVSKIGERWSLNYANLFPLPFSSCTYLKPQQFNRIGHHVDCRPTYSLQWTHWKANSFDSSLENQNKVTNDFLFSMIASHSAGCYFSGGCDILCMLSTLVCCCLGYISNQIEVFAWLDSNTRVCERENNHE